LSSMSFIDPLYLVFLLTGFTVGFGHCVGMCGPIVVSLSLNLKGRNVYLPHLLYNAGRVTTYTLLGGLMGATGSFSMVASNIAGIQQGALIFAGVMIIIMALAMSGWLRCPWEKSSATITTRMVLSSGDFKNCPGSTPSPPTFRLVCSSACSPAGRSTRPCWLPRARG